MSNFICVTDLKYQYPSSKNWALDSVNLMINRGEFVILVGPSGSGKSTLLRALRGMLRETGGEFSGSVIINEKNVSSDMCMSLGDTVAIVLQNPSYQLHQPRVVDEIMSAPMYQSLPWRECLSRAEAIAKLLLSESLLPQSPSQLSLGQQQRVAIAASLVMKADIVLLDEPFSYLDGEGSCDLAELIMLLFQQGKTIVVATHEPELIPTDQSTMVVMEKGRIVSTGPYLDVINDEKTLAVLGGPLYARISSTLRKRGYIRPTKIGWRGISDFFDDEQIIEPMQSNSVNNTSKIPLIELVGVEYTYPNGKKALESLSLNIYEGDILGVIGPNGSGKTTLAGITSGLISSSKGKALFRGRSIREIQERAKCIGYVTQNPSDMLFETTVRRECYFGLKTLSYVDNDQRVDDVLIKLGIDDLKDRDPHSLSGGQQRLLSIAAFLSCNPEFLIFDEPEFGLDPRNASKVRGIIRDLSKNGKTIMLITHKIELAALLCNRLAFLNNGVLYLVDDSVKVMFSSLVQDTLSDHERSFLNLWSATLEDGYIPENDDMFASRLLSKLRGTV